MDEEKAPPSRKPRSSSGEVDLPANNHDAAAARRASIMNARKASLSDKVLRHDSLINASGHPQQMDRIFGLLEICGMAITTGNTWLALGGTLTVAIYNGGPPGVIYEFMAVSVFYWCIAASIAELASAMPSSGGVYHWATITAGSKYGRVCGFFAGWWNFSAWVLALAATANIVGAQSVSMYAIMHPDFVTQRWHVFVSYIITTWVTCAFVLFLNRALPRLETIGGFLILAGFFVTIIVCAVMPHANGQPYATNDFVWRDWENATGYSSNGFVFCLGMLNGAFAVGVPDVTSHLAEEIPSPSINIPKAILAQYLVGFLTAVLYLIAILYSISDLSAILDSPYFFPLTEIYHQNTGSAGGSLGLLIVVLLPTLIACCGCVLTASRIFWTLARDNATPFSPFFSQIHPAHKNPARSILLCGAITTVLGCIYVGSLTAFNAFVGSFVILSTLSYLAAILPHLLSRRRNVTPGWFWMPHPLATAVHSVSCAFILVFIVIFCFPFSMPVDAASMNYACLITGGLSVFAAVFWFWRRKDYEGPKDIALDPLATEVLVAKIVREENRGGGGQTGGEIDLKEQESG